ncbi:metal-dependent hydrolase family protein [Paraburkholderia rhizosphaerae]|uniref:Imidazolonepropionase-like amidohydrolase n=1 Tax=Paraburkholderia rhizosphaerae TaxID=480658 RepID=A0A4R8M3C4_9BURK|nr:amidohydrolase family protein [Paraburkholderia rhizosphaerae]TDY54094.1 imidazolonepropionase-like amidohydrolase [Paraburkholderia rhizosphaerae]
MESTLFKNAALLDPTRGEMLETRDVLVEDGLIKEVSDRPLQSAVARVIDLRGKTLMPGLIDLHVHVVAVQLNLSQQVHMPNVLVTLRSVPIMRGMLRRGFTTVRDAGGANAPHKTAIESGLAVGPRMFVAGRALSPTGGHGDMRARSDYLGDSAPCGCCVRVGALSRVADGIDEVRKAAREELQMGADHLKIMASGGVASPTDPVGAFGFAEDEVRAIVDEARARHTYVMAHAYTAEAIARVVRCGVRTIEHGNLIDAPTAKLMAEAGTYVVPTLVTYDALASEGAQFGLAEESVAKIEDVREAGKRSLEIYRHAGVKMGFGSDLLGPSQRLQSNEFLIRADVLGAADAIRSATVVGAEVLGLPEKLGCIAPGAWADMIVVDGDPLTDIACLTGQGERIPLVMKGGKIEFDELAR